MTFARSCSVECHASIKVTTIVFLLIWTTAVCDAPIDVLHLRNFRFRLIKIQYLPCVMLSFWRLLGSSFPIKLTAPLIISKTLVIRPYNSTRHWCETMRFIRNAGSKIKTKCDLLETDRKVQCSEFRDIARIFPEVRTIFQIPQQAPLTLPPSLLPSLPRPPPSPSNLFILVFC